MVRSRKMVVLPDWQDSEAVKKFISKVLADCHQQNFPDYQQEFFSIGILKYEVDKQRETVLEMIDGGY